MIAWIKIGLRNLAKNRRRTVITAMAIALGFAAVNLFGGFAEYMHTGNEMAAIYGRSLGHLVVFKKELAGSERSNSRRLLLTAEEIETVEAVCAEYPEIDLVTPQLMIRGLLSNGKVSTIFLAQGVVPSARKVFLERLKQMAEERIDVDSMKRGPEGRQLEDDKEYGVALARGLAKLLNLELGSYAAAFTNTVDGHMNALDVQVFQLLNVGSEAIHDKFMIVPFSFAQSLYDTDGAERMAVLLKRTEMTNKLRGRLARAFEARGLDLEVKTWREMSEWYQKVKDMFDIIFRFLFAIVFVIVVMSVVNTMSMAVLERTREIGTLRALGLKKRGVLLLFAIESSLLGGMGTLLGLLLTVAGRVIVEILEPRWVPPGVEIDVIIWIEWVPAALMVSFVFLLLLCLVASIMPARRAAGQNIVDALGYV
jgi:putative ABC transport system permease protein